MILLSFLCDDCRRPWAATPLAPRSECPFCGAKRVRETTPRRTVLDDAFDRLMADIKREMAA